MAAFCSRKSRLTVGPQETLSLLAVMRLLRAECVPGSSETKARPGAVDVKGGVQFVNDGVSAWSKVVLLPAVFTRSWCFHHEPSATSSATRATKLLQSLFILALKRLRSPLLAAWSRTSSQGKLLLPRRWRGFRARVDLLFFARC